MRTITEINNDSKQQLTFVTEDDYSFDFYIEFKPTQNGWFFDIEYGDFISYGNRLCNSPNILRQFKNILPFGIACTVNDGGEPYFIDDFASERVQIHLLTASEVLEMESDVLSE